MKGKSKAIVFAKEEVISERMVEPLDISIQPIHANMIKHSVIRYNPGITIRKMS